MCPSHPAKSMWPLQAPSAVPVPVTQHLCQVSRPVRPKYLAIPLVTAPTCRLPPYFAGTARWRRYLRGYGLRAVPVPVPVHWQLEVARNPQSQAAPPSAILFHHRATEIESSQKKKRSLGHGLRCATRPGPQNLTPTRSCFVASGIFVRCFTFAGKQETRLCIPDLLHGVVRASKGALPAGSRCL
jgi:hypothetical protein